MQDDQTLDEAKVEDRVITTENVEKAFEDDPAKEKSEEPKQDPGTPEADAKKGDEPEADKDGEKPEDEKDRSDRRNRIPAKQRIGQLTAEKRTLEAQLRAANQTVQRLKHRLDNPPKIAEDDYDGQAALRAHQLSEQARVDDAQAELEQLAEQHAQVRRDTFVERCTEAETEMPGLLEKFSDLPVSPFAADFIAESSRSAEIAKYFVSNPKEAHAIHRMPVTQQGVALARLEAKLERGAEHRKTSNAPPPTPKIEASSTPEQKQPGEMSEAEYIAWYRERERKRES